MSRTKEPQISRFETNHLYSNKEKKAIEQFTKDLSKLYLYGFSQDEIKNRTDVRSALHYLDNKFENLSLDNCINYVFSRDEIHHRFGLWYQFDYMLPLHAYNFAKTIIEAEGLDFEIPLFASFIFFLITHYKSSYNNAYEEIKDLKSKRQAERNINYLKIIKANKQNARVFYKAKWLYDIIGIKDQHTFREYIEAIPELEVYYRTTSKDTDDYTSRMYIIGINKLIERLEPFITGHVVANNVIANASVSEIVSGVDIKEHSGLFELHSKYEKYHIRNKKLYLSYPTLINNPIIKIERYNKRVKCFIQSEFADFTFIFNSLYRKGKGINPLFRKHLVPRPRVIIDKSSDNHLANIREKLIGVGVNEKTSRSEFYSKFNTPHFKAIKKCMLILSEVSNNGILVDKEKLIGLTQKYGETMKVESEKYTLRKRRKLIADSKEDEEDINDNKDIGDIENKFLKYRAYHSFLVKLIRSTNSVRNDKSGETRIYGLFTPHGASTHRMTCHNVNLQGIPKIISKEILRAPEGEVLLSADVSGQDIMVAANLAIRLYDDVESFPEEYHAELNRLAPLIKGTIEKLKNNPEFRNRHKPIDFISDQILIEMEERFFELSREQIRKSIKKIIYVNLFGGGENTAIKSATYLSDMQLKDIAEKSILKKNISTAEDLVKTHLNSYFHENAIPIFEASNWNTNENILENLSKYIGFIEDNANLIIADDDLDRELKAKELVGEIEYQRQEMLKEGIKKVIEMLQTEIPELIYKSFIRLLKEQYPGIIESFEFYKIYYEEHKSTYPTLLGWTTPVSQLHREPNQETRSKSYPIQASGAEFLREWLIELSVAQSRGRIKFNIVNLIHDQIVVEVLTKHKDKVRELMIKTAKKAAMKVKIDASTLHFGEVEILS